MSLPLRDLLRLSYVPRWVIVPMTREQNVADHSWRVAVIGREIAKRLSVPTSAVIEAAVMHDITEVVTGDIPASVKPKLGPVELQQLTDIELIVKVADNVEAMVWLTMWGHHQSVAEILATVLPKHELAVKELTYRYQDAREVVHNILTELNFEVHANQAR